MVGFAENLQPPLSPYARDSRGSLEIFNPTASYSSSPSPAVHPRRHPTWTSSWSSQTQSPSTSKSEDVATSWKALPPDSNQNEDVAAQRAAEWGLVLKTDTETGKPQGVTTRTSGGDEPNSSKHHESTRRDSGNSVRTSGDSSDEGMGFERNNYSRISNDLKDALFTFQQTFGATKPDFPIMYTSAGFFKMTGYRFFQDDWIQLQRNW